MAPRPKWERPCFQKHLSPNCFVSLPLKPLFWSLTPSLWRIGSVFKQSFAIVTKCFKTETLKVSVAVSKSSASSRYREDGVKSQSDGSFDFLQCFFKCVSSKHLDQSIQSHSLEIWQVWNTVAGRGLEVVMTVIHAPITVYSTTSCGQKHLYIRKKIGSWWSSLTVIILSVSYFCRCTFHSYKHWIGFIVSLGHCLAAS